MELLSRDILEKFRETGSQELIDDPVVIAKYFYGSWTWFATEYNEENQIFFWFVVGQESEWGYFSLQELQSFTGNFGLKIERDLYIWYKTLFECLHI